MSLTTELDRIIAAVIALDEAMALAGLRRPRITLEPGDTAKLGHLMRYSHPRLLVEDVTSKHTSIWGVRFADGPPSEPDQAAAATSEGGA